MTTEPAIASELVAKTADAVGAHVSTLSQGHTLRSSDWNGPRRLWARAAREIIIAYREHARDHGVRGGRAAVITAGAPGSGKTSALSTYAPMAEFVSKALIVDADDIKGLLLGLESPSFPIPRETIIRVGEHWEKLIDTSSLLPDGRPLLRNELATLVHPMSLMLHDVIRRILMSEQYDVVVEGTLGWGRSEQEKGQGLTLIEELAQNDYETVHLFAIDTPQSVSQKHALQRWWKGRQAGHPGGRFTPAEAICCYFPRGPRSVCIDNAVDTYRLPFAREQFTDLSLTILDSCSDEASVATAWRVHDGEPLGPEPDVRSIMRVQRNDEHHGGESRSEAV